MSEIVTTATVKNPVFWVSFVLCAGLVVAGFCVPPTGQIDGSVLTAIGELFAFPTLWTVWHAIDKGIDARVQHGKTSLTVGNLDGKETEYQLTKQQPENEEEVTNE